MLYINKSNSECYDFENGIDFPPGEVIESEATSFVKRKLKEGILGEVNEEELQDEEIDLNKLTVPQLKELAAKREIDIDSDDKKQEIIDKIKAGA
ncbi:SAP domain-containing protein [Acetoanaerobium sticklandii]|uniref:SAP domain-containing protein n=1 Tax=Acetoanaerobium sticklandii TaxID=1511 RepID=UPI003A9099D0